MEDSMVRLGRLERPTSCFGGCRDQNLKSLFGATYKLFEVL